MRLADALPSLVADLESALVRLGRPQLAAQLREALLAQWQYDEFSDTTYLSLGPAVRTHAERLSLYDELGVNVDCDERGALVGIEILDGKHAASLLAATRPTRD